MSHPVDDLLEQAKKLSPSERAALIDALYELNQPHDPEWEAAWIKECEDRLAAYDRGETDAVDFDESMAELRRKHGLK